MGHLPHVGHTQESIHHQHSADEPGEFFLSDDDEFDDLTMEGLFLPVASLWQVLGAIDEDERLTPLAWWACPRPCSASGPRPVAGRASLGLS